MFEDHYIDWREKRLLKLLEIYPKEFFNKKTVLELACGLGDVGNEFIYFGAEVTFAEGRFEHYKKLTEKFPNNYIINLDQNGSWNLNKKYDIIIHWGVLYHLDKWQEDLKSALRHSDLIFLESEVADSDDPNFDLKVKEKNKYDQALRKWGSRPSADNIEKVLKVENFKFKRFDDLNLNSSFHKYDWEVTNTNTWSHGLRRFWIASKV